MFISDVWQGSEYAWKNLLNVAILDKAFADFFHVLAQFPFMISEAELDYYHQKVNVRVAESVKT